MGARYPVKGLRRRVKDSKNKGENFGMGSKSSSVSQNTRKRAPPPGKIAKAGPFGKVPTISRGAIVCLNFHGRKHLTRAVLSPSAIPPPFFFI